MATDKQHYNSIVKRGLINDKTSKQDFRKQIIEEFQELIKELYYNIDNDKLNAKEIQESVDLVQTIKNMFIYFDVDYNTALEVNINHQLSRKD